MGRKLKLDATDVLNAPTEAPTSKHGFRKTTVASVLTLGHVFKRARKQKKASLIDAELGTSVSGKYLTALEEGRYCDLPADVYVAGFVRRYATWLNLDPSTCISRYRSERALADHANPGRVKQTTQTAVVRTRQPLSSHRLWITPERFIGLVVSMFVLAFVGYLWFQVKSFAAAPPLDVANSVDNQIVKVDTLTLSGSTDANAKLAVNGQLVPVDQAGKFTATIHLVDGVNTIELKAENRTDQQTVKVLKVLAALDGQPNTTGPALPVQQ